MARLILKPGEEKTITADSGSIILQPKKDIDFKLDSEPYYITLSGLTILRVDKDITIKANQVTEVVYFK
jgi:hypothetical protein